MNKNTENQKVIQSAASVVKKIFEASNNKQYLKGLEYYSGHDSACFVSGGVAQTLEDLKKSYAVAGANVEDLHNDILEWHTRVISEELVSFTLLVKLRLKLKNVPEYTGQIIWSAFLQKFDDRWLVVQSHESWQNSAEVQKALNMRE